MCRREGIGDVLADGAKWAAQKIGRGAEELAMHAGGEMLAMHDPRCFPGWGATYISDSTPGRHTRGGTAFAEHGGVNERAYAGMGVPFKLDPVRPDGQGAVPRAPRRLAALGEHLRSLPVRRGQHASGFRGMHERHHRLGPGLRRDRRDRRGITTLLHGFNLREGFKPDDFKLPERARGNPPMKAGALKGVTIDSEGLKKQFYEAMGFDCQTGAIDRERIVALGLDDVL